MPSEINYNVGVNITKAGVTLTAGNSAVLDLAGDEMLLNVQPVGTAAEALNLTDLATVGLLYVRNMEPVGGNYVELSLDEAMTKIFEKLLPQQIYNGHPQTNAIWARANTDVVRVHVVAAEV